MFSVGHWNCLPPPPNSFACCIRCETRKIQFKDMPCTKGIYVAIELAVYGSFLLKSRNKKRNLNTAPNTGEWTPPHLKQRNWRKKKKKVLSFASLAGLRQRRLRSTNFFSYSTGAHCWKCSSVHCEILWTTQTHSWLHRGKVTELHKAHWKQSVILSRCQLQCKTKLLA